MFLKKIADGLIGVASKYTKEGESSSTASVKTSACSDGTDSIPMRSSKITTDEICKAVRVMQDQTPILNILSWFYDEYGPESEMEHYTIQFISASLEYKISMVFPGSQTCSLNLFKELINRIGDTRIKNVVCEVVIPHKEKIEEMREKAKDSESLKINWNQKVKDCGVYTEFIVIFVSGESDSVDASRVTKKRKEVS